jgi:hypothetical protein
VEGSTLAETEKEMACGAAAGNVEAPDNLGSFAPPYGKRMIMKYLIDWHLKKGAVGELWNKSNVD